MMPGFSFCRLFAKELEQGVQAAAGPVRIEKRLLFPVKVADMVLPASGMDRFYFRDRRNGYEAGAIGSARVFAGDVLGDAAGNACGKVYGKNPMDEIVRLWKRDPRFRLFGGMSFFPGESSPEWESFGQFRFVLPLVALTGDDQGCTVVVNLPFGEKIPGEPDRSVAAIRSALRELDQRLDPKPDPKSGGLFPYSSADGIPAHVSREVPDYETWSAMVQEALAWLPEKNARKVVLARKKILKGTRPWDPLALFSGISRIAEDSFLFFCAPENGDAFLGRSPERLFCLKNGLLASDAIAGTRRRGERPDRDRHLASELMASAKDIEEHRIVVDYIREHMERLCEAVSVERSDRPLRLKHLQHLITRVSGRLRNGCSPLETIRRLHPTPAVGGVPPEASARLIRRLEPFGRGWYAAPVGWMDRYTAEFAVGIRSALVRGDELHIFGGAGIVPGSDPEMEWRETGDKMENFSHVLGGS